jgi:rubredoxin
MSITTVQIKGNTGGSYWKNLPTEILVKLCDLGEKSDFIYA